MTSNVENSHLSEPSLNDLMLKTLAMPSAANAYGDIFGGWLVSQMDIGGSLLAHKCAQNRVTTVSIDGMVFLKPVSIGDCVSCYASVVKTGRSSIVINVSVWAERRINGSSHKVTEGIFTFVAIDEHGKSKAIDWQQVKANNYHPPM